MDLGFEVVDLGPADYPDEGSTAPDFTRPLVNAEFWENVSLSELTAEAPVCLVTHSMAGAFPATYIWNELRDRGFDEYDAHVVGLSISTPYEFKTFIEQRSLAETDFRFFADPANDVAEKYGIVNDLDGMAGISEPRPAAFVIDTDRTIQYAWVAREWPELPDYEELETALADVVDS